jgi:heterodisulfide reductase subunit A-like polyferredoxin
MDSQAAQSEKKVVGAVLVVGAGIAGIQASLDLADSGFKVHLLESSPAIGGTMAQLDKTFPTNDCSMCILSPKVVECARHLNINLMTWSELESVEGQAGNFTVRIRHKPRYVVPDKCTGCSECTMVCPIEVPNAFDENMGPRKAIYRPFPQAVPNIFAIDKRGTSPCKAACPAGTSAQGYVALIAQRRYAEALELSRKANPFTSVCGRICYHPCETACSRQLLDEPAVSIASLKRFMADYALQHGDAPVERVPVTRKEKIAVVGAGPCGLTAAQDLALLGYEVTVYESKPKAGGMLRYGIPDYRLPQDILDQEIQRIADRGVAILTDTRVQDFSALRQKYDAVLLGVGAHYAPPMRIPGENLPGVYSAIDFLRRVNAGERPNVGSKVVVVGGGNTAIDAARCALRLGAESTIVYRRSRAEMPAYAFEVDEAEQEGVALQLLTNPVRILDRDGRAGGLELLRMRLGDPDASGRRQPIPIEDSNYQMEADTVILAIGQMPDLGFLPEEVKRSRRGTIAYDEQTLATSVPGVFTGGDAATGPRSAIEAVGMGHRAAESIHRYLSEQTVTFLPHIDPERVVALDRSEVAEGVAKGRIVRRPRAHMAELSVDERIKSFAEVGLGFTEEQAVAEAERCLACGVCSECYRCVDACKPGAINHDLRDSYTEMNVGAVLVTTGFDEFDARRKYELGYSRYADVVSSIEFERLLSASGPCAGHVQRPSDGAVPHRIAFLQCVGSRDQQCGNEYCSSVCCMYAIKEAVIAREHDRSVQPSIFFMDMRAFGKDFDKYYERARDEYGVRFMRARVAKVDRKENGALDVVYQTEDEQHIHEEFDMVVLSVGLEPSKGTRQLIEQLKLRRGEGGFVYTDEFKPLSSSRLGVYVGGAASGPKDIPETVMQASAAAAEVGELLASQRKTLTRKKEYPPEIDVSGDPPRVGVFVCHCGINIAGTVDVEAVREYASTLPYVVYTGRNLFTCSGDTIEAIKKVVQEHQLNRVVVASCSPRTHEPLFQETIHEVGLNPYLFELANIRDQCSWVHMQMPAQATDKAKDLVRMAVNRAVNNRPLHGQPLPITHSALVIGGGITGMTAALKMAGQGYDVSLIERDAQLGGNARHIHSTLRNKQVQEKLSEMVAKLYEHPRVTVYLNANVKQVDGFVGNFHSVVEYRYNGSGPQEVTIDHGVIIVATGAEERKTTSFLYGQDSRVVTQRELEEALARGSFALPSKRGTVVMIQCVESRNDEHPYCSRVCCSQALKNAIDLKTRYPESNVIILYRDIRSYGLREKYYQKARDLGVLFVRYDPDPDEQGRGGMPQVENVDGCLVVRVYDPVCKSDLELEADTLALSVGIAPRADAEHIASMLKVPLNAEKFFLEAHMKLRPVDFATEGIFVAGMAHTPKFIEESIAQACAAVSRSCTVLAQDELMSQGSVARVDQLACVACGDCVKICPYKAPQLVNKEVTRRNFKDCAEINLALCKACGACVAACRSGCITLDGFDDVQIMAQIAALVAS